MMRVSPADPERLRDGAAGFLLTETLATFALSAFVLVGLVSATTVLLRSIDRSVVRAQDVDDLGRTLRAVARDVSGLTRARWNGIEPQSFVFRGTPDSLVFARIQRDADWPDDTQVIALRERIVGPVARFLRSEARLPARATTFDALRFTQPQPLGTASAQIRFRYVPAQTGRTEPTPLATWPMGLDLPAAIIVEAVQGGTGRVIVSMRLPVQANADVGCLNPSDDQAPTAPQPQQAGTVAQATGGPPAGQAPSSAGSAAAAAHAKALCSRTSNSMSNDAAEAAPDAPAAGSAL